MLLKMILSIEYSLFRAALMTSSVVMPHQVVMTGIGMSTIGASEITCRTQKGRTLGRTLPFLQRQMQGLFMTSPVMLCLKRFCAKRTLKWVTYGVQRTTALYLRLRYANPSPSPLVELLPATQGPMGQPGVIRPSRAYRTITEL
jgi:hypothetical protein